MNYIGIYLIKNKMSYYSEEIKAIWQKQHIIPVTLFANLDRNNFV